MCSLNNPNSAGGKPPAITHSRWEFTHLAYLKANPEQLFNGDTLKMLCIAAELDIVRNIERAQMREKP